MTIIYGKCCRDPNDINKAIISQDKEWKGLTDASQIISITFDGKTGYYAVFWRVEVDCEQKSTNVEQIK